MCTPQHAISRTSTDGSLLYIDHGGTATLALARPEDAILLKVLPEQVQNQPPPSAGAGSHDAVCTQHALPHTLN
jgi:hypothetical protein